MSSETANRGNLKNVNKKNLFIGSGIAVVFVVMMAFILFEGTKKQIVLHADGEQLEVSTHAKTVEDLLAEQNIKLATHDFVEPKKDTALENGSEVKWIPAQQLAVVVDGKEEKLWTTKKTVQEVLTEAGVDVNEHDEVSPSLASGIQDVESIAVTKALPLTIVDAGKERTVWSTPATVNDVLKKEGIQLTKHDRLEGVKADESIAKDKKIEIVRIERKTSTVEEPVQYAVEKKQDPNLLEGETKIIQEGQKGKVSRTYENVVKNGENLGNKIVGEKVVAEPKAKVIAIGTKKVEPKKEIATTKKPAKQTATGNKNGIGVSRNNGNKGSSAPAPSGGREFYVEATAYTPYCAGCSGISAAGINLRANPNLKLIAADPRVIPMGTKVWVEGYGHAVVGDTGGAIKGNRIDVLMQTKSQAYSWGRKKVKIKILN